MEARHAEETRTFREQIRVMEDTSKKAAEELAARKTVKELTAYHLTNLEARILAIRRMSGIAYNNGLTNGGGPRIRAVG
jgi:hypothetical protein